MVAYIMVRISSYSTQISYNLSVTSEAKACYSTAPLYVMAAMAPNSTTQFFQNYGYSAAGYNTLGSGPGFAFGPNNTFANPQLTNPSDPGAPHCSGAANTVACMSTTIANFKATSPAAAGYGYQSPSNIAVYDPLFPQWLCNTNLPPGLVTMGCLTTQ